MKQYWVVRQQQDEPEPLFKIVDTISDEEFFDTYASLYGRPRAADYVGPWDERELQSFWAWWFIHEFRVQFLGEQPRYGDRVIGSPATAMVVPASQWNALLRGRYGAENVRHIKGRGFDTALSAQIYDRTTHYTPTVGDSCARLTAYFVMCNGVCSSFFLSKKDPPRFLISSFDDQWKGFQNEE